MLIESKSLETPEKAITLKIVGKIGASELVNLGEGIKNALGDSISNVMLDLSELEFINSMGIGKIVLIHKTCQSRSGKLEITSVQPKVMKLFKILCLDTVLTIHEN